MVEETLAPGAKVTDVARRNGVAASVVFTWRRQGTDGRAGRAMFYGGADCRGGRNGREKFEASVRK
ncbi:transposase [Bradyrhizobium sp. 169]|nr:transposase [Bradyrhizobium sp. 169]